MEKYKVLFFGTWGYGKAGLEGLVNCSNVEIAQVFTKWDAGQADPYINQVKDFAKQKGLPIYNTGKDVCSKEEFHEAILAHKDIDLLISCCYDRIFKSEHLDVAKLAALNVHPSLLPKYRGVKPLENAIVNGEVETGVTLHKLTDSLDAGEIVLQMDGIRISQDKTYEELYEEQCKLITSEMHRFFRSPLEHLINAYPQNEKEISWAPRLAFEIKSWMTVKMISLAHWGEWGSDFLGNL